MEELAPVRIAFVIVMHASLNAEFVCYRKYN